MSYRRDGEQHPAARPGPRRPAVDLPLRPGLRRHRPELRRSTPSLPQAGSDTRSYWEDQMNILDADVNSGVYPCIINGVKDGQIIEENTGTSLDAKSLVPYLVDQYIEQSNGLIWRQARRGDPRRHRRHRPAAHQRQLLGQAGRLQRHPDQPDRRGPVQHRLRRRRLADLPGHRDHPAVRLRAEPELRQHHQPQLRPRPDLGGRCSDPA